MKMHLKLAKAWALPLDSWLALLARSKISAVNTSGFPPSSTVRSRSTGTSTASSSLFCSRACRSLCRVSLHASDVA